jgi:hypothetical protein
VSGDAWVFRAATSSDGSIWRVHPHAVLKPEVKWEKSRIFYPTVLKIDGVYLMWYGSYWSERTNATAIGFAVSRDGFRWNRNSHNPVIRPDPGRPWESNYTTSQSVIHNNDGSFRIWYASRKKPPFVNKYFAINTATWSGPDTGAVSRAKELRVSPTTPLATGTMTVIRRANSEPQDLIVHFHGAVKTVTDALRKCDRNVALAIVNFPGLSTAYSKPFVANPGLFKQIQERAAVAVAGSSTNRRDPWRHIYVSSFSAGYGAVREILRTPVYFEKIDGIVAADSIYASLQQKKPQRKVDATNMRDFQRFAALAVDRKSKTFVLSHSAQPTPYASTTETADYLLQSLNIDRKRDTSISTQTIRQISRAERGQFFVFGFKGTSSKAHMQHLHNIDLFWQRLPLDN